MVQLTVQKVNLKLTYHNLLRIHLYYYLVNKKGYDLNLVIQLTIFQKNQALYLTNGKVLMPVEFL